MVPLFAPAALQPWALALIVQRTAAESELTVLPAHGLLVATMVLRGQVSWQRIDAPLGAVSVTRCDTGQCHVQGSQSMAHRVRHSADAVSVSLLCRASVFAHAVGVSAAEVRNGGAPDGWWRGAPWGRWAKLALTQQDEALAQAVWPWLAHRCLVRPERGASLAFRPQLTQWLSARALSAAPPANWSERRWQRACLHETGLTPHQLRRIWRVHRSAAGLHDGAAVREGGLAAWAVAMGYADQAHLSREMRTLLGTTPRAWGAASDTVSLALAERYHA